MKREFGWLNGLLWGVSVVGYLIFLFGLIVIITGGNFLLSSPGPKASITDMLLIGFFAFNGLIVGTVMQAFRVAVGLNDKAIKIMEQMELMDVRIRSVVPQNRQLKQLDSLKDLVDVNREMLGKLNALGDVQGEFNKAMESFQIKNVDQKPVKEKSSSKNLDPLALLKDEKKWVCTNCKAENPGYLFKCRECGRESTHK